MKDIHINLKNLSSNLDQIRKLIPKKCAVCATVKADAYGCGILEVSQTFERQKVNFLGITCLKEAKLLRDNGIKTDILLYIPYPKHKYKEIIDLNLIPFVSNITYLKGLEKVAKDKKYQLRVHIKIDVGMGRLGCLPKDYLPMVDYAIKSPFLDFHGFCSHLSESEQKEDPNKNLLQLSIFETAKKNLKSLKKVPSYFHIANSFATLNFPQSHHDLVRPGILLYGTYTQKHSQFLPVLSLNSQIAFIKEVPAGHSISYNSLHLTKNKVKIAAIPLGYVDGLDLFMMKRKAKVYIKGNPYPIVGKVCMNIFTVEIPLNANVSEGDNVELIGENQSLEEWASYYCEASSYTILCRIGSYREKTYKYPER